MVLFKTCSRDAKSTAIHQAHGRQIDHTDPDALVSSLFVCFGLDGMVMILPQVHLRKPCYDFTFL
jgi:hypothetical protein